jgi:hypothetical protein
MNTTSNHEAQKVTPMALRGMTPVEITAEPGTDPSTWAWTPQVRDPGRLVDALHASNNTSKLTFKSQWDHGEGR